MRRAVAVALGASLLLGVLAAALDLNEIETDLLTIAAVPLIVLAGLGVNPTRFLQLLLRRR